jgi:hypothetical protein
MRAIARHTVTGLITMGHAYAPLMPVVPYVEPWLPVTAWTAIEPWLEEELVRPRATVP